jgi:hypothetical protein
LEYWNAGNWETAYIFLPIIPLFQNSIIPVGEGSQAKLMDKENNGDDPGSEKVNRTGQQR